MRGRTPLLWVLRDYLDMTGTKFGCGMALCGASRSTSTPADASCVTPPRRWPEKAHHDDRSDRRDEGRQACSAWVAENVPQCGYCQWAR